jgi:Holliday junction DNA helicase RuvA
MGYIETQSGLVYLVHIPPHFLSPGIIPVDIELYTHLQVREDAHILYGFEKKHTYTLFLDLISISGVGPKVGFTISSLLPYEEIMNAVQSNDVDTLTRVPGLGKKTAMKIILEMSQKVQKDVDLSAMNISEEDQTIVDTLVALGFENQKVRKIIRNLTPDTSMEEKIKEGIRLLSK